jgi:hypothetical protein
MIKIALSGKASVGKNTFSKLLFNELNTSNISVKNMAFADPIKEIILLMFPHAKKMCLYGPSKLREEIIPNATKNNQPLTYRQALCDVGTELGRGYNDKVWVENFAHRYKKALKNPPDLLIITDCRFKNEYDFLKENGFFTIRIYRDGKTINHSSETNQNLILDQDFDYVVDNNGNLEDLKEKIKKISKLLK